MALRAEEGRGKLRKAAGRCKQSLIRRFPNGATRTVGDCALYGEHIAVQGEPGELKHLRNPRKRK